MNKKHIKDILLDIPYISNISFVYDNKWNNMEYEVIVSCQYIYQIFNVDVYICVPKNWDLYLIDIFIYNYDKFSRIIPHVENKGKLCLFELEGKVIDTDFEGIFLQCIEKGREILSSLFKCNVQKEEFIKEFAAYWRNLPNSGLVSISFSIDDNCRVLDCKTVRGNITDVFVAEYNDDFRKWNINGTLEKAIYVCLKSERYILPPDYRNDLPIDFISNILKDVRLNIAYKSLKEIEKVKTIIIKIYEPNDVEIIIGAYLRNITIKYVNNQNLIFETRSNCRLVPLSIRRMDELYLKNRVMYDEKSFNKKILLIGCGSIGSYVCEYLSKVGYTDITIVDNDILTEENIYRHVLGIRYVRHKKSTAMANYIMEELPYINVKSIEMKIEDALDNNVVELSKYDIIVSAVGNHILNRWLDKNVSGVYNGVIFYAWNEPLDIGSHIVVVDYSQELKYSALFRYHDDTHELYCPYEYTEHGQEITSHFMGCGGSFIKYSTIASVKVAAICVEYINKFLQEGNICTKLISIKGNGNAFEKANYLKSSEYNLQDDMIKETIFSR